MEISVCPYLFTDNVAQMSQFLTAVGLVPIRTSGPGYVLLRGRAGFVALHSLSGAGTTNKAEAHLCLMVPSLETSQVQSHPGIVKWDESWGLCAAAVAPDGSAVWINEADHDLYGYEDVSVSNEPHAEVVMVRYSHDFSSDREFFSGLGFHPAPGASAQWEQLSVDENSGWVAFHHPDQDQPSYREEPRFPVTGKIPLVHLSFQTRKDLAQVVDELVAAGFPARIVTDEFATKVHATDPNGNEVQIHPCL